MRINERPSHWPTRLTGPEMRELQREIDRVRRESGITSRSITGIDSVIEGGRRPNHWPELIELDRSGELVAA